MERSWAIRRRPAGEVLKAVVENNRTRGYVRRATSFAVAGRRLLLRLKACSQQIAGFQMPAGLARMERCWKVGFPTAAILGAPMTARSLGMRLRLSASAGVAALVANGASPTATAVHRDTVADTGNCPLHLLVLRSGYIS